MKTKVLKCECVHQFQDQTYSQGNRVHNPTTKGKSESQVIYRCTVCNKEQTVNSK